MKATLVLAALATGFLPMHAWAAKPSPVEVEKREQRSVAAFEIFRKACFSNLDDLTSREKFLLANYFPASEGRAADKLAFVHARDGGTVWNTSRSEAQNMTIVSENNGQCHVLVEGANAEKLHKQMKDLALDTKDSMTFSVIDYKGVTPDVPVQTSKFDVKDPDGTIYFSVYMVTKMNEDTGSTAGVISVTARNKK
jgi:hypothetical protein